MAAALGLETPLALEVREVAAIRVGHEHDVAAVAAVAAVGAAVRDVRLAAKAQATIAAAAGHYVDARLVVEHVPTHVRG